MDYNRSNNQTQRFQRNYKNSLPNPYGRGHFRRNNTPYGEFSNRQSYNNPRNRHRNRNQFDIQGPWQPDQRTFDERGREVLKGQGHISDFVPNLPSVQTNTLAQLDPLENKARSFLQRVQAQDGIRSKLIFLETVDNALQTLQSTVDQCQLQMVVAQNASDEYVLKIGQEEVVKGSFPSKQTAKNALAEQAMTILKKDCFYIIKKKEYEDVSTKTAYIKQQPQTNFEGSRAHQMMLKMGWGGKGLGINEQGGEKTVAETLDQNISRQGLGTDNVFKKIHSLLEEYSKSDKISLLRFDPDFTSEERAHIHKIASKFGLKSKSEGKGEERRITITKKLHRSDLVFNLLTCGLENMLYQLIIPPKFAFLWYDEEEDDNEDEFKPQFTS